MLSKCLALVFVVSSVNCVLLGSPPSLSKERSDLLKGLVANNRLNRQEKRLRASILRDAERSANAHNHNPNRQYNKQLNKFSLMTHAEKTRYLGLQNLTLSHETGHPGTQFPSQPKVLQANGIPGEFDHRDHGHVTTVKDQQGCGSCWAFAAAGAFEGSYSSVTGVLKSFSAKELLDCSYSSDKKACKGGWYTKAWNYIKKSGRLAAERDIPYFPAQEECSKWDGKPNGIRNADYFRYYRSGSDHESVKQTIKSYTPAVALIAEDDLFGYKIGHYDGCETPKKLNHGVILVGYGADFWEAKNSWGKDWGDKGYVKFTRSKASVCRLLDLVYYPVVLSRDRGEDDEPDVHPDGDLVDVAAGKSVTSSEGSSAPAAVDGDKTTCSSTNPSYNPYFKVSLGGVYRVHKVEIVTDKPEELVDGKVHVGTRGDFLDRRIGVIEEVEEGGVVVRAEEPVEGSWVFVEVYMRGLRSLSICEIRVLAADTEEDSGPCPGGTTLCPDGVCRHSHMC